MVCEILNRNFQKVFTQETVFEEPDKERHVRKLLDNLKVDKAELLCSLNGLDGKKAMGPDNISGQVLKECSQQLTQPIHDIIQLVQL